MELLCCLKQSIHRKHEEKYASAGRNHGGKLSGKVAVITGALKE